MKQYNITDIVKNIVGETRPYGSHHIDEKRLENLNNLVSLTEDLIQEILECAKSVNRHEHSMMMIGQRSVLALKDFKDLINEELEILE